MGIGRIEPEESEARRAAGSREIKRCGLHALPSVQVSCQLARRQAVLVWLCERVQYLTPRSPSTTRPYSRRTTLSKRVVCIRAEKEIKKSVTRAEQNSLEMLVELFD